MTELPSSDVNQDPTYFDPKLTGLDCELLVNQSIDFFSNEFGLDIDNQGRLNAEPSTDQLTALHAWHKETTADLGIIMPTPESFAAKVVLANALLPQVDSNGRLQYLFGKGVGLELALQGNITDRSTQVEEVPYRTHSDFEIYTLGSDDYSDLEHSDRFRAVFGPQEIFPQTKIKGLSNMPEGFMDTTAEIVDFGGIQLAIPQLEVQFVDKFEKGNERVERRLRDRTDVEWLTMTYDLDLDLIHEHIDQYVIAPQLAQMKHPEELTERRLSTLERNIRGARRNVQADDPNLGELDLVQAMLLDDVLTHFVRKIGIIDPRDVVNSNTGQMTEDARNRILEALVLQQTNQTQDLQAKHQEVDRILKLAA